MFQNVVNILTKKNDCDIFRRKYSLRERKEMFERISHRFPERIPLIIERLDLKVPEIDRCRFLIPPCLTIGNLAYIIRKRIKLSPEQALFLLVDLVIPPASETIGNVYDKCKNDDGFLYVCYTTENTFGSL